MNIPKVIHYCWFGNSPLSEEAKECIESWKKFCPDYEIKEWNESNFDVFQCEYTKEAYMKKKWAFVSDYARFWILYNYGGVYLDTDVELIKALDSIINKGQFMAKELGEEKNQYFCNPGLGMAAKPFDPFIKKMIDYYDHIHFIDSNGKVINETIVLKTTKMLSNDGFKCNDKIEYIDSFYIYPAEYFCPLNYFTNELRITDKTYSIHHYSATWSTNTEKKISELTKKYKNKYIRNIFILPLVIKVKFDDGGLKEVLNSSIKKFRKQ